MPTVSTAAILEQLSDGVILADASGRVTFANAEAERIHGAAPLGVPVEEYASAYRLYTLDGRPFPSEQLPLARAVLRGESVTHERWLVRRPDGREVVAQGSARPLVAADGSREGAVLTVRDVTGEYRLEQEQEFLLEAGRALSSSLDYEDTLQRLARLVVPRLADWCVIDLVSPEDEGGPLRRVATYHADPEMRALAEELEREYPSQPDAPAGPARVVETGQPECVPAISDDLLRRGSRDERQFEIVKTLGLRSYICVPLESRGQVIGALTLIHAESNRACGERDVQFALEVAGRVAVAVDNARLFSRAQAEIAERRSLEATLRESEQRLETTLRSIGDAVIVTDPEGRVTLMNDVAEDLTGWAEAEAVGRPCEEVFRIINEYSRETVESPVGRVIREGVVVGLANHTLLISKRGAERPIDDSGAPVFGPGGRLAGVVLVFRDVTERRGTERALRQQADLLELTGEAIFVHGEDNRITYWNRGAERKYGWSREEAIGRIAAELLKTQFPVSYEETRRVVEEEGFWEGQLTHTCKGGRRIVVASRWAMQRDDEGNPLAILEANRDITSQLEAQAALRESEARFRTIVEQSPFSTQVLSPDGKTVMVNRAWEELWGLTLEQIADYNMLEDRQLAEKGILPYVRRGFEGEPTRIPAVMYDPTETIPDMHPEGDPRRWVEAYIYPVKDDAGAIRQVILVHLDVTSDVRAQEASRKHAEEITALNERLQRAMLETHHRVKNNLQMIAAFVDMLKLDYAEMVPTRQLSHVGSQVKALATVHDLLTGEAKSSGDAADLSARDLLERLIAFIRPSAPGREIRTSFEDVRLSARQGTSLAIVTNELVTNAVKHSRGEVEVRFRAQAGGAVLEVLDDGGGFPSDFDPLGSDSHGLSLVTNVTQWDLQGEATFVNRDGGGGQVVVTFPLGGGSQRA